MAENLKSALTRGQYFAEPNGLGFGIQTPLGSLHSRVGVSVDVHMPRSLLGI